MLVYYNKFGTIVDLALISKNGLNDRSTWNDANDYDLIEFTEFNCLVGISMKKAEN